MNEKKSNTDPWQETLEFVRRRDSMLADYRRIVALISDKIKISIDSGRLSADELKSTNFC